MITSDTDASLKWCLTPPLWRIDAVGGVHPIINPTDVRFAPTAPIIIRQQNDAMGQKGQPCLLGTFIHLPTIRLADLLRISRAIWTAPREAERIPRACGIRTR